MTRHQAAAHVVRYAAPRLALRWVLSALALAALLSLWWRP